MVREHGEMGYLYCEGGGKGHSNSPIMQSLNSLPHDDHHYEQPGGGGGCQEITDIPDDYLNQSQVKIERDENRKNTEVFVRLIIARLYL